MKKIIIIPFLSLYFFTCNEDKDALNETKTKEHVLINNDTLQLFKGWLNTNYEILQKDDEEFQKKTFTYQNNLITICQTRYLDESGLAGPYFYKNRFININNTRLNIDEFFNFRYKVDIPSVLFFPAQDIVIFKVHDNNYKFKIRLAQAGCSGDACYDYETLEIVFGHLPPKIINIKGEYYLGSLEFK